MEKHIKTVETSLVYVLLFLVPIFFLPIFQNPSVTGKLIILVLMLAIILLLKVAHTLYRGSLKFTIGTFDVPLLFLAIAYIASAIMRSPNKMEAVFFPGTATIVVGSILTYFILNQLGQKEKRISRLVIVLAGAIVAISSLVIEAGSVKLPGLTEGHLPSLMFLVSLLPLSLGSIANEDSVITKAIFGILSAILILGVIVSLINVIPGKANIDQQQPLPPFTTSWEVAVDSLKVDPILGVGPGNYLTAFNKFRSLSYNQTPLWATRFTQSRNFYLTTITEVGLLGATGLILLGLKVLDVFRRAKREKELDSAIFKFSPAASLILLMILMAIFPASINNIFLLAVLLALASRTQKASLDIADQQAENSSWVTRLPVLVTCIPTILLVMIALYLTLRVSIGEAQYYNALQAANKNNGKEAYDLLRYSITTNPYIDRYRTTYAQINLALANSIAQKGELSQEETKVVSTLIQQSIRQGKDAVALNPDRSGNWETLGNIYKALIPSAKGSDQFAIETLSQAINLDPFNPNLRILLGGVFYSLKSYDQAIEVLKLATSIKPDHANAHYNLAIAYREKGEIEKAINELNIVLTLLEKDSKDWQAAKATLEDLEKKRPPTPAQPGDTLTAPQQVNTNNPQVELPSDANPPAPAVSPTPSSSPSPTITP